MLVYMSVYLLDQLQMTMTLSKVQPYSLCVTHSNHDFCHYCPFGDISNIESIHRNTPVIDEHPFAILQGDKFTFLNLKIIVSALDALKVIILTMKLI